MIETLSGRLAVLATLELDRNIDVRCLRGVRGVPDGAVARLATEAFEAGPPQLPRDGGALTKLFSAAYEDGLIAIGLLATVATEAPAEALALALEWAEHVDDVGTSDAIGWLVLAPAAAVSGAIEEVLEHLGPRSGLPSGARRAAVAMGMGFVPVEVVGAAAAPLRAKLGSRHVRMVDAPVEAALGRIASTFVRDDDAKVRKAMRRLLRAWVDADPESAVRWGAAVPGGLPRMLGDEIARGRAPRRP